MQVIHHSDDLGFTPAITARILQAWREGLLDGFSVLANGSDLEGAREGLAAEPDREARISAHLNLFEGPAQFPYERLPLITDMDGQLNASFGGLLRTWMLSPKRVKTMLLEQIEVEWRAQLERIVAACAPRKLSAVDGHLHFHMLPFLFPIAAKLAREFEIPEIRIAREPLHVSWRAGDSLSPAFAVNVIKNLVLRVCARSARRVASEHDLRAPDALVGLLYTGRMTETAARAGLAAAQRCGAQRVELLLHVGRATPDEALRWKGRADAASFPLSAARDAEYAALQALRADGARARESRADESRADEPRADEPRA
ncbi:MAG: hypothetical protein DHS20C15_30350 [Planctomycetota bacterium]|nr:MAG: hypothetical protein DHS20C15_30350 [Planctomycetota bacterium]